MGFLTGDLPKYLFCTIIGITICGAIFYKVQRDQVELYKMFFTIDVLLIQEIEQIWHDSNVEHDNSNSCVDISVDEMTSILLLLYKQEENRLVEYYSKILKIKNVDGTSKSLLNSTYILTIYHRFHVFPSPVLNHINQQIYYPLALRRCQNIIQQLNEKGSAFAIMLLQPMNMTTTMQYNETRIRPEMSPKQISTNQQIPVFKMTKQEYLFIMSKLISDSLHNDLFDFLEGSYSSNFTYDHQSSNSHEELKNRSQSSSIVSATTERHSGDTNHLFAEIPVHNSYGSQIPENSPTRFSELSYMDTSDIYYQAVHSSPLNKLGERPQPKKYNSRQSDVFDYMAKM